jgi:chromosomal replication initiator protein
VPVSINSSEIILGVSDEFFADWLNEHYGDILSEAVKSAVGNDLKMKFETGYYLDEAEQKEQDEIKSSTEKAPEDKKPEPLIASFLSPQNCRSEYTFDNFVVGEENRYAHAAAATAAKSPGVYNPLYIHGSSGIGKTHLIQAVAHEVLKKNPKANVRYMTCESFLNQYVDSLKMNKHSEFRNFIRNVDILLVDDVHQLANKVQLQEEFFNTFNTLYNHNKQIILTSDKQPCEIQGLEDRLVSRFASGVTTEITKPSFETRLAILKMKQEKHIIKLNDDVLHFIANRITSSVRMLVGALIRLVAFSSAMANCKITTGIAENLLNRELEKETVNRKISIDLIQRKVAEFYDIRLNDILSRKRPKNIAEPRMIAMYLSRKMTEHSLPEIGAAFGKNHATVMHAISKVEGDLSKDEATRRNLSSIQMQIQS